jgi:DNA phosphorothioation-dependent restriction protein DptG
MNFDFLVSKRERGKKEAFVYPPKRANILVIRVLHFFFFLTACECKNKNTKRSAIFFLHYYLLSKIKILSLVKNNLNFKKLILISLLKKFLLVC